jgi:adenylylsulfate kinase-like enzyme
MVDRYMAAEAAVLDGQEIMFNGRKQVMSDLPSIRAGRLEWERRVAAQQNALTGRPPYSLASFS